MKVIFVENSELEQFCKFELSCVLFLWEKELDKSFYKIDLDWILKAFPESRCLFKKVHLIE